MEGAGIDARRGRGARSWILVRIDDAGLRALSVHPSLDAALADCPGAAAVTVNLPLAHDHDEGGASTGRRAADEAVRRYLAPEEDRHALHPPPRLYDLATREDAVAEAARHGWPAPARADWEHRDRVHAALRAARAEPRLHEAYPEVSFQALARTRDPGARLERPRHTTSGFQQRLALLHGQGLRPARSFGGIGRAHPEDVLDATVLAWTALRVAHGTHLVFGDTAQPGAPGRRRPHIVA